MRGIWLASMIYNRKNLNTKGVMEVLVAEPVVMIIKGLCKKILHADTIVFQKHLPRGKTAQSTGRLSKATLLMLDLGMPSHPMALRIGSESME